MSSAPARRAAPISIPGNFARRSTTRPERRERGLQKLFIGKDWWSRGGSNP
jgi:hypothetical protein